MSARNGHKAKFRRQQMAKILLRKNMRDLRRVLMAKPSESIVEVAK